MARISTPGLVIVGVIGALTVVLVASTLRRPELPTFPPSPMAPAEAGAVQVGPSTYTIDASDAEQWRYFDFSRGSRVERPDALGWDLAFRRFNILVNGGPEFDGQAGVLNLGEVSFDSITSVPMEAYAGTSANRDSVVEPLRKWYKYSFTTHVLSPLPRVYAVRTADGRYAKLEILSYYCPGAQPGCVTFRYVYQGGGGTAVGP